MKDQNEDGLVIALPTPEYVTDQHFGGLATYLYKISKHFTKINYYPIIFLLGDNSKHFYHEDVEIIEIKHRKKWWFWLLNAFTLFCFNTTLLILSRSLTINKHIKSYNQKRAINIIQYSNAQFLSILSPKKIHSCLRLSHYYYEYSKFVYAKPRSWKNLQKLFIERLCIKKAKNRIYGPSSTIGKLVSDRLNIPVKLIRTPFYKLPVKLTQRNKQRTTRKLLYFGTLSSSKGVDLIANILNRLLTEFADIEFIFVGRDTPLILRDHSILTNILDLLSPTKKTNDITTYSQLIKSPLIKHNSRIHYLSIVKPMVMQQILQSCSIVVLPSRIDNFPNTLSEAMSAGKLVVVSSNSSLDEIVIDGKNGFVFNNGDENDLYVKLVEALQTKNSAKEDIVKNALLTVADLYPEKVIEKDLLSFYENIIN